MRTIIQKNNDLGAILFKMENILILGRQKNIALAELASLYGSENFRLLNDVCVSTTLKTKDIDFRRLGGSIKMAEIIGQYQTTEWVEIEKILHKDIGQLLNLPVEGKMNLGISTYDLDVNINQLKNLTIQLKKSIKKFGQSIRLVPNQSLQLNSAQIIHNRLLTAKGIELLLIRNGQSLVIARTTHEQDIDSYSKRDYDRPYRDSRVGMLPPKLAQILINLANPEQNTVLLDPFCGTGVVLQEALLDGLDAYGTDLEPRMIDYSAGNLKWLENIYQIDNKYSLETEDATGHQWKHFDNVASETYLGQAYSSYPEQVRLTTNINNCNTIISKFLDNIHDQLPEGKRMALALPAWKERNTKSFISLPLLDHLEELGYNRLSFSINSNDDLFYHREGQIVARQLIVITRK